jgi:hypothetical protein
VTVDQKALPRVFANMPRSQTPHLMTMPPQDPTPVLTFGVSYALREYLSIVRDHVPDVLASYAAEQGKPLTNSPRLVQRLLIPVLCVGFWIKKRQMPWCEFRIDAQGIQRVTRLGTLDLPWTQVVAVHRYTQGYLVRKANGGIPLPYRCFTPAQRQGMELLVERWRLSRDAPSGESG